MTSAVIRARCSPELAAQVTALARHWELQPSDIVRLAEQDDVLHYASAQAALRRPEPTPEAKARVDPPSSDLGSQRGLRTHGGERGHSHSDARNNTGRAVLRHGPISIRCVSRTREGRRGRPQRQRIPAGPVRSAPPSRSRWGRHGGRPYRRALPRPVMQGTASPTRRRLQLRIRRHRCSDQASPTQPPLSFQPVFPFPTSASWRLGMSPRPLFFYRITAAVCRSTAGTRRRWVMRPPA